MSASTLGRLAAVAADQWGLVTRRQAEQAGVSPATLQRLATSEGLERLAQGVYRLPGAPMPDHAELRAAWLQLQPDVPAWERTAEQGVISHRSAARLYDLGGLPADRHEFTLPMRRQSRRRDVRLHHRSVASEEWTWLRGLPVTRPARIVSDLLGDRDDPSAVAQVLADALRQGLDAPGRFAEQLASHAAHFGLRRGDGLGLLRRLLDLVGELQTPGYLQEAEASLQGSTGARARPPANRARASQTDFEQHNETGTTPGEEERVATTRRRGGGAAAAAGFNFQSRVCAWIGAHVLAGSRAGLPWLSAKPMMIRCETSFPVDDLFVEAEDGSLYFVQVKHGLNHSASEDSPYASCIQQGVELVTGATAIPAAELASGRTAPPFAGEHDQIVIVVDESSSTTIRHKLHEVLLRFKKPGADVAIDTDTLNLEGRKVLETLKGLTRAFWVKATGSEPTDADLARFFRVLDVITVDLRDETGQTVNQARTLLRSHVVSSDDEAQLAWDRLVTLCLDATESRRALDDIGIRNALGHWGLGVLPASEYREDVRRLKELTADGVTQLQQHTTIRFGGTALRLRRGMASVLLDHVVDRGLVVVGDPGVGKSGILHDVIVEAGPTHDVVVLSAAQHRSRSKTELRTDLGLEHHVADVLVHWPGSRPAILVVDALDAVRGTEAARVLADLITTVEGARGRWHVIASIRRYDLRQSAWVREAFGGAMSGRTPIPTVPEFHGVRHAVVSQWADDDVMQVVGPAPRFRDFIAAAPRSFRELMGIPFNLRLAAELFEASGDEKATELHGITTQLELLDRYWDRRVREGDIRADLRDAILQRLVLEMIDAGRLVASRPVPTEVAAAEALDRLLSNGVLNEWTPPAGASPVTHALAFSHAVIFDYAVERLIFRGVPDRLHAELSHRPRLPLMTRPSIGFHYRHLWATDRSAFWRCIFEIGADTSVPVVARVVGPSVLSDLARVSDDIEPLRARLFADGRDDAALSVARNLTARLAVASQRAGGPPGEPWSALARDLLLAASPAVKLIGARLLELAVADPDRIELSQRTILAEAASLLTEWVWSQAAAAPGVVRTAIEGLCRTFEGAPATARTTLMKALEPAHLAERGHQELFWLAQELGRLVHLDPDFVRDAYAAAFSTRDDRQDPVALGGSRILPLTSTRAQDYDLARYVMTQLFGRVVSDDLRLGLEILSATLTALLESGELRRWQPSSELEVAVAGERWRFAPDGSSMWIGSAANHQGTMLTALEGAVRDLAGDPTRTDELLAAIRSSVSLASMWKRVLLAASTHPTTLGRRLLPVVLSQPFVSANDLASAIGTLVKAVHESVGYEERRRIERRLLSIPKLDGVDADRSRRLRDAYLTTLAAQKVSSPAARRRLAEIEASGTPPASLPPEPVIQWSSRPWTEDDHLQERGVALDDPRNAALIEATRPLRSGEQGAAEDRASISAAMRWLYELLESPAAIRADEEVRVLAWQHLTEAAKRLANETLTDDTQLREAVKAILLEAADHPRPRAELQSSDRVLGDHSVRWDAAMGLMRLASRDEEPDRDVLDRLRKMAEDPHPFVRLTVVVDVVVLYRHDGDMVWDIVERAGAIETDGAVLEGLVRGLWRLAPYDSSRVRDLLLGILRRPDVGEGQSGEIIPLLAALYAWRADEVAGEEVRRRLLPLTDQSTPAARACVRPLREAVGSNLDQPHSDESRGIRTRAFELLAEIARAAGDSFAQLREEASGEATPTEETSEKLSQRVQLADAMSTDLLLLCRPFVEGSPKSRSIKELRLLQPDVQRVLRELGRVPAAGIIHDIMQTLEVLVEAAPAEVLLTVRDILEAGRADLYSYDASGADLALKIAQRYLADYGDLLQDRQCEGALLAILDELVEAGWPNAYEVVARLDELYR